MQHEISTSDLAKLATALTKAQEALDYASPWSREACERHAVAVKAIGEASALILKLANGAPTQGSLVESLAPYVSGDDTGEPRAEFLESVRDRIDSDLAEAMAYRKPLK